MSQNGQAYFENLAAFAVRCKIFKCLTHFGMLCIKEIKLNPTQPAFTYLKLTIEIPEQGKKYVQS